MSRANPQPSILYNPLTVPLPKITPGRTILLIAILFAVGLYLATHRTAYARATEVTDTSEPTEVFGKADFHAIHSLGLVAGTVHRNDCLFEGVTNLADFDHGSLQPSAVDSILAGTANALRAQGYAVTQISAGPLETHEKGHILGRDSPPGGRLCTFAHDPIHHDNLDESNDNWIRNTFPPDKGLAQGMAKLPYDAVLVVDVLNAETRPYQHGSFWSGYEIAEAYVHLAAQLITKDGATPWSARISATGRLLHPGLHTPFSSSGGPAPYLEPVIAEAIARLTAITK